MSALEITLAVATGLFFLLSLCLGLGWLRERAAMVEREVTLTERAADKQARFTDLHSEVLQTLIGEDGKLHTRYEIRLADWGPDFTGVDGVLPRWRWVVLDADRRLKAALGVECQIERGTEEMPFMLGNAPTAATAVVQAMRHVEISEHPVSVVVGLEEETR